MDVQVAPPPKAPAAAIKNPPTKGPGPGAVRKSVAMDWGEMILAFVAKGRINKAAIFDRKGKCMSTSPDLKIPQDEVISVVRCLDAEFVSLNKPHFGLFFGEDRFICFRADKSTVIGLTKTAFFVAHMCDDVLIFAFSDMLEESNVSCLAEVWTFAREVRSRMDLSAFIG